MFHPYAGYQQFLPRLVSGLVVLLLPTVTWAYAMVLASCMVVGAVCALTYVASAELVDDIAARLLLSAIPVLTPITGIEPIGNFANLHWYMPWAAVFLALLRPRRLVGGLSTSAAACAAALTEIQVLVLAPLMLWMAIRRRESRWAVAGWAVGSGGQLITWVLYPRGRRAGEVPVLSAIKGYAVNGALSDVWGPYHSLAGVLTWAGWVVPFGCLAALLAAAVASTVGATPVVRAVVGGVVLASAASWFLTYYVNNSPVYDYDRASAPALAASWMWLVRWGTAAAMLLLLPIALLVVRLRRRDGRAARIWLALLMVVLLAVASNDVLRPHRDGASWPLEVHAAQKLCRSPRRDAVAIPITPHPWHLGVPCSWLR